MEFQLLGDVEARIGSTPVNLGPARQRFVLVALLADANKSVSADQLLERVWGGQAPVRGRTSLYSYITRLRQVLAHAEGVSIATKQRGGYAIQIDPDTVDLHQFRHWVTQARTVDTDRALALLEQALALWRGEAFAGLDSPWANDLREDVARLRQAAELDLNDLKLCAGRHSELVAELATKTARRPLDERLAGQFMLALYLNGRLADALAHYQRIRRRLAEELGTDPSPPLGELHQRILNADPDLIRRATSAPPLRPSPVPRQLPPAPSHFVGRAAELADLADALDHATLNDPHGPTVLISAIAGAGGVGKTCLALHWAHRHAARFPDGQLFVDLQGFSPIETPMDPATAVRGFLTALGVRAIPPDLHAQIGMFRSLVADKRMLIVVDNARTTDQVLPLLPGSPTCTVLVTSRRTLNSLIGQHGAHHLRLDTLSEQDAYDLLTRRAGTTRVAAEPEAVGEIIKFCHGFPLALVILAARAHSHPQIPLAELAAELRQLGLGALDDDPTASLSTVLSWSYKALTAEQQEFFGLLGIAPGPTIGLPAAASLAGLPLGHTSNVLGTLAEASLLVRQPGGRFAMHDLIRDYAAATARDNLTEEAQEAALRRILSFYTHTAHAADHLLDLHRSPIRLDPPAPGTHSHPLPDDPAAMAWFDTEHPTLLAAQHTAAVRAWHWTVWQLAWTLGTFHYRRGHLHDRLAVWRAALDAATHLPDPTTSIRAHRRVGRAFADLQRHEEATGHLHQAIALAEHHHNHTEQAHTHRALAWAWAQRGDNQQALDHATRALDLFRVLDQPVWVARALNDVGWYAARLGDYDTARIHCQAALPLHQQHHDPDAEADTLDNFGYIEHHTGQHHCSIHYYHQALALHRKLGNTYQVADALDGLGHPHAALGHHEHARIVWQEALQLYQDQERNHDAGRVQQQLEALHRRSGNQPS